MVSRGRFVEQEDTQRHLLMALAGLLIESFEQCITSKEQAVDLAGLVWVSNRKATLPDDHADKIHAQDVPVTHWRDSVWVDTQDGNLLVERECFRNRVLLPIMAKHGGVMFCRIGELREVMNMYKASGCVPYVIVDAEYADV